VNRHVLLLSALFVGGSVLCVGGATPADQPAALWEIGKIDRNNAEFALAPKGYAQFKEDAFFVIGSSDPKKDWPYVQPGPVDGWAGSRLHTFIVLFGLKSVPGAGDCRLEVHLLDTQNASPPALRVEVNGQAFEQTLPAGAGDASVFGQPDKGRPHIRDFRPATLLKTGDNEVRITTLRGSWISTMRCADDARRWNRATYNRALLGDEIHPRCGSSAGGCSARRDDLAALR
jgi:hypothetical protein